MKLQDAVNTISGSVKLPASVTGYLQNNDEFEDDDIIKGGVLQDFKFAWVANGSKFVVINIKTGHKIAAWTFGAVLRDFKTCVTCVCEIPPLIENTKQLLIGLECDMIGGLVCLFHCQGSRVLRAIRLDCRVSCIQYVDRFLSGPLECFDGTVIIGTHGGSTLAFDLNQRSCLEAIVLGKNGRENLIRDELNIGNLFTLSLDDISLIQEQRAIACEKDDHIAIQINEGCFHNLQFILHGPNNAVRLRATRERVFVTSLLYIPQLSSVVIGFNFGVFQVWNTITMELEYTSPVNTEQFPISHFGFLEPCDDPRAFCYLWVIYSALDRHVEGFPLAAMYAFSYQGKASLRDRVLYQNFVSCNLRFNVELGSIDSSNFNIKQMVGGRCIACHTLNKSMGKNKDSDESVLNLCQIVWECWTVSAIAPVQSVMFIFDIDQWYKEQMPELTTLESNSFLSVVNLGDSLSHTASCNLCDVKINNDSLAPFYSVPRLEEHYYPNSLGYECVCLTNVDVKHVTTVGVQRQLLSSLNEMGPSVLLHPTKVFMQCLACGLIPLYLEPPPNPNSPIPVQRQTILSIALEARLICFLSDCARDWATGCHSSLGCSFSSFTQWAWSRSITLKSNADQLTKTLFDHSGDGPDVNSVSCLESCTRQLGHVAKLLNIMLNKFSNLMVPEAIRELKQKQKAVQVVSLYFQVIQWFLNVGLLPEFSMNSQYAFERNTDRLPYPVNSLVRYYQNRRLKLHCLNGENPAIENLQNKPCSLLFIDQFIKVECEESKLKKFWCDDGSETNGLYPPPSLYSLLKTYLVPDILDENKHSLVLYMLVDYAMTFDEAQYESVIRRLMQFPTMFGLSSNAIKITQAFWHLDHRDFELALDQLESVVAGGWLKPWQHNVALSSLLVQNKTQAALQYLYVRKPSLLSSKEETVCDDWETCCNLYLSRGLLLEAFNLTKDSFRTLSSPDLKEQRMIMFLEGCKKMSLLSKVLTLPLTGEEEAILTNFLRALGDSNAHDLLVMYYLQRSRFIEAQHVNDNLKRLSSKGQLPYDISSDFSAKKDHIPKTKTRDELVDMYCKTLPKVTRNLAHMASQYILPTRMTMPTPMTVNLQAIVPKPATYRSSIIQATINKANETWLEKPGVVRNLKRALQVEDTPFICTPKMERHSSRLNDFEKMITTPEDIYLTPAKRPRLSLDQKDEAKCTTPEDPIVLKEVETLLHTPIVERKTHWRSDSRADSTREATPQSILKVRTKLLDGNSSFDDRYYAETDEEFDTASLNTQSDNLSRSIRFNIPSPGNSSSCSLTPTELNDSYEELSEIQTFGNSEFGNISTSLKPGGRKSIHDSVHNSRHTSTSSEITTPVKATPLRGRILISPSKDDGVIETDEIVDDDWLTRSGVDGNRQNKDSLDIKVSNEDEEADTTLQTTDFSTKKDIEDERIESVDKITSCSTSISEKLKQGPQPRRSLRSTPERERDILITPRVLRSRSKTPEPQICSPVNKLSPSKRTPGQKVKKSLARIVLETNALSASKNITKTETTISSFKQTSELEITQNNSGYPGSVTTKLTESVYSLNESLLTSDVSDCDISMQIEFQENTISENKELDNIKVSVIPNDDTKVEVCDDENNLLTQESKPDNLSYTNECAVESAQLDTNISEKTDHAETALVSIDDDSSNIKNKEESILQPRSEMSENVVEEMEQEENIPNVMPFESVNYNELDNFNTIEEMEYVDNVDENVIVPSEGIQDSTQMNIDDHEEEDNQDPYSANALQYSESAAVQAQSDESLLHSESDSSDSDSETELVIEEEEFTDESNKTDLENSRDANSNISENTTNSTDENSSSSHSSKTQTSEVIHILSSDDEGSRLENSSAQSSSTDSNYVSQPNKQGALPSLISQVIQLEDPITLKLSDDEAENIIAIDPEFLVEKEIVSQTSLNQIRDTQNLNIGDPNIEPKVENLNIESNIEDPHIESNIEDPIIESNIEDPIIESNIEEPIIESNIEDPHIESNIEEPIIESNIEDPHIKSNIEEPIIESNIEDPHIESNIEDPHIESNIENPIIELNLEDTNMELNIEDPNIDDPLDQKLNVDTQDLGVASNKENPLNQLSTPTLIHETTDISCDVDSNIKFENSELNPAKVVQENIETMHKNEKLVLESVNTTLKESNESEVSCMEKIDISKSEHITSSENKDSKVEIISSTKNETDVLKKSSVTDVVAALDKDNLTENCSVVESEKPTSKGISTPKRIVRRRSSSKSDISSTTKSLSENVVASPMTNLTPKSGLNESEKLSSQGVSTPKRILRRRSSAKSDAASITKSSPENIVNLEYSPIHITRSATKKTKQSPKASNSPSGSEHSISTYDDTSSIISDVSRKSLAMETSSLNDQSFESRKSRKSTIAIVKSNLSVIPEVSQAELEKSDVSSISKDVSQNNSQMMEQYLSSKRLTRNQKSLLEKSFTNVSKNTSIGSKKMSSASTSSSNLTDENLQIDTESEASEKDFTNVVNLEKEEHKGQTQSNQNKVHPVNKSPSMSSESSEVVNTQSVPRGVRSQSVSSDATGHTEESRRSKRGLSVGVDESATESPGRPRRRSFNKAIEALSTPKRKRRMSTDSKNETDGESDTSMSDRMTPNIFKERIGEMNQSKLMAIEEDDVGEDCEERPVQKIEESVKPKLARSKKASSSNDNTTPVKDTKKSRSRMSQLLTPLSKEEQEEVEVDKPRYRRRTTMHKIIQPIEFVIKKK